MGTRDSRTTTRTMPTTTMQDRTTRRQRCQKKKTTSLVMHSYARQTEEEVVARSLRRVVSSRERVCGSSWPPSAPWPVPGPVPRSALLVRRHPVAPSGPRRSSPRRVAEAPSPADTAWRRREGNRKEVGKIRKESLARCDDEDQVDSQLLLLEVVSRPSSFVVVRACECVDVRLVSCRCGVDRSRRSRAGGRAAGVCRIDGV